jgi:hypothetical protein
MVHYKTELAWKATLTFTPLLMFALKQYSIIKLYTNNRSEKNWKSIDIRRLRSVALRPRGKKN